MLGGDGGWDCLTVDSDSHRLYIARGNRVMVVDTDSLKLIGEIAPTPGSHDVALIPGGKLGFATAGFDTSAAIFDPQTLKITGHVRTGLRPDVAVYDPASKRVFVMNAGSASATAIDAGTGAVAGTVELGGRPEFAVPDGNGHLFVNLEDSSQVRVVDTKTMTAGARWGLGAGEEPTGIAMDTARQRLFVSCANSKMVILDSKDGRIVATLPTGKGVDGAGFDPALQRAFSPSGSDSVLTVIGKNGDSGWEVLESVPTERGARTMALDEVTHRVYLVTAKFGPPPAPTADRPRPRAPILPGTFEVLVYGE